MRNGGGISLGLEPEVVKLEHFRAGRHAVLSAGRSATVGLGADSFGKNQNKLKQNLNES